jgi:YD repeat-containing protein
MMTFFFGIFYLQHVINRQFADRQGQVPASPGILYQQVSNPSELRVAEVFEIRRRRVTTVTVCTAIGIATVAFAGIWLGPLLSGGLFLSWPSGAIPSPHGLSRGYEPKHRGYVDIATGLYVREDEDLVLAGDLPFALTRTYLSGDRISRHFGIGTTHNGEWYLIASPADFRWAELIRADGSRVHFDRTSRGTSYLNAMFLHRATSSEFYGARLGWTGFRWVLRLQNGSRATFQDSGSKPWSACSIIELQDPDNHAIRFERDADGTLQTIRTPYEFIALDYDNLHRIVAARDDTGNHVKYTYDTPGRLVRVTASDGKERSYTYGPNDELLTIDEPGVFIENAYDADGRRVIRQVVQTRPANGLRQMSEIAFSYTLSGQSVIETDETEYDGTHTIYQFDVQHHTIRETHDAAGANPVTVSFTRGSNDPLKDRLTVSCNVKNRRTTRSAMVGSAGGEQTKYALMQATCPRIEQ